MAADATNLGDALQGVTEVVALLQAPHVDNVDYSTTLNFSDDAARDLFASSADLTEDGSQDRAIASDAAGLALDISHMTGNALAYRTALEPALTLPTLETDPGLTDLVTAAEEFGAWWAHLDEIVTALPQGVAPDATDRSTFLLGELMNWQASYVDAIRVEDEVAAAAVLADLQAELDGIRVEVMAASQALTAELYANLGAATQSLDSLVG